MDELNKVGQQLVPIPTIVREQYIKKLSFKSQNSNVTRPMVVAHSGYGKTWLKNNTNLVLDIDDYIPSKLFDGSAEKLASGANPYKFIAMSSGVGKSHIIKYYNPGNMFVEIDDLVKKLDNIPEDIQTKFDNNVVDAQTTTFIRENIHLVLKSGQIVLVHCPSEIPDGGELIGVLSFYMFEDKYVKSLSAEKQSAVPVNIPQDDWHNWSTISYTRQDCLKYSVGMLDRKPVEQFFKSQFGLSVKFDSEKNRMTFGPQSVFSKTRAPLGSLPSKIEFGLDKWPGVEGPWVGWKIFNRRKWDFLKPELAKHFPQGWANRSAGKLMLVHTHIDVQNLNGLQIGTVEYDGSELGSRGKNVHMIQNRKTNREFIGKKWEQEILISKNRVENVRNITKLWNRYIHKFAQVTWFDQFKIDKLEQGVIKHFNDETKLYLDSTMSEWLEYQDRNDVLYQNWFMGERLYNLKRYRPGEWNYNLAYLSDCCAILKEINPKIYKFITVMCMTYNLTYKSFAKIMKSFSNMVKAFNNDWSPHWEAYIDLARLQGFSLTYDTDAYVEDLESWLLTDDMSKHYVNGSEDEFIKEFEISVSELLSENAPMNDMTPEEFIDSPHEWAVSGSAKGLSSNPVMVIDGKPQRLRHTKRTAGFFADRDELLALFNAETSDNYIFDKSEPIRNRPVVNSSMDMYLKMSYLDKLVYKMVGKQMNQTSPIFKDFDYMADKTYQAKHINDAGKVCLPLDQTGFERQTNFRMIDAIISVIRKRLDPSDENSHTTLNKIQISIRNSKIHFPGTRIDGALITNGLSSGWKWTAFFNTVINLAEFLTCARLTGLRYRNLCALGDDTRVWLETFAGAQRVLDWYKSANIKINEKLSIMSRTMDEFLRKVTESIDGHGIIHGYYNRMLVSICYRNPKAREPSDVNEAIETSVSNWFQLFSRIGDATIVKRLEPMMYDDVDAILKSYKVGDVDHMVLHTPRNEGGFGVSKLRVGGPSLITNYNDEVITHQLTAKSQQLMKHLIRRHKLVDTVYEMDRSFTKSFGMEMSKKKVIDYEIKPDHHKPLRQFRKKLFGERRAYRKLSEFARELTTVLNSKQTVKQEHLPYQKALMVPTPKGNMQASGFFQSIYDKTPDQGKPELFTNPATFEKLVHKLGYTKARDVVFKGVTWSEFRNWEYDTDFFNLITSQFVLYWYETSLFRYINQTSLMLLLEELLPEVMANLNFTVHS